MMREVYYLDWLVHVVVVKNKNGKNRVCIDLTSQKKDMSE